MLLVLQAPGVAARCSQLQHSWSVGLVGCSAVGPEISLAHPTEVLYHIMCLNTLLNGIKQYNYHTLSVPFLLSAPEGL